MNDPLPDTCSYRGFIPFSTPALETYDRDQIGEGDKAGVLIDIDRSRRPLLFGRLDAIGGPSSTPRISRQDRRRDREIPPIYKYDLSSDPPCRAIFIRRFRGCPAKMAAAKRPEPWQKEKKIKRKSIHY